MASFQSSLPSTSYPTERTSLFRTSLTFSKSFTCIFWLLCWHLCPIPVYLYPTASLPLKHTVDSVTTQLKLSNAFSSETALFARLTVFYSQSQCPCRVGKALCGLATLSSPWAFSLQPPHFVSYTVAPSVFLGYTKHTPPWGLCTCYSLNRDVLSQIARWLFTSSLTFCSTVDCWGLLWPPCLNCDNCYPQILLISTP